MTEFPRSPVAPSNESQNERLARRIEHLQDAIKIALDYIYELVDELDHARVEILELPWSYRHSSAPVGDPSQPSTQLAITPVIPMDAPCPVGHSETASTIWKELSPND
jgi:hypothetical protein